MQTEQEKYNKNICFLLALILMFPLFTNFFGAISNKVMGTTTYTTYAIYGAVFCMFGLKYRLKGKKFYFFLILTSVVLGIIILNRIVFPKSYLYMQAYKEPILIMLMFYYPIAYAMTSVTDWEHFFRYMRFSAFWTPLLCWIAISAFDLDQMIDYMQISNTLLPGFLAGWYIARVEKKRIYYLPSIISLYLQIFYGSRMSFGSALIFVLLIEVFELRKDSSVRSVVKVTFLTISAILGIAYFSEILNWFFNFLESLNLTDSRTVQYIISGNAFESKSRDAIYEHARHELSNLGMGMYGFFGDRIALGNVIYVHNVFYELIFTFGWIIGGAISAWLVVKIAKTILSAKDYEKKLIVSYFVCLIFLRLLVSGSFVIEGPFLLLLGALMNKSSKEVPNDE